MCKCPLGFPACCLYIISSIDGALLRKKDLAPRRSPTKEHVLGLHPWEGPNSRECVGARAFSTTSRYKGL